MQEMEKESNSQSVSPPLFFINPPSLFFDSPSSLSTDYTWYLLLQALTWTEPQDRKASYAESNGLPKWRASDAKEDWAEHFANIMRRDDTETKEADVDEDGLTMKEERELKWAEENQEELEGMDKVAMRAYYKVSSFFLLILFMNLS